MKKIILLSLVLIGQVLYAEQVLVFETQSEAQSVILMIEGQVKAAVPGCKYRSVELPNYVYAVESHVATGSENVATGSWTIPIVDGVKKYLTAEQIESIVEN